MAMLDECTGRMPGDPRHLRCKCGAEFDTPAGLARHKRVCPIERLKTRPITASHAPLSLGHSDLKVDHLEPVHVLAPNAPQPEAARVAGGCEGAKTMCPTGLGQGKESTARERSFGEIKAEIQATAENTPGSRAADATASTNAAGDGKGVGMGHTVCPGCGAVKAIRSTCKCGFSSLKSGRGTMVCPGCGGIKSKRWPCKTCGDPHVPRTRVGNAGVGTGHMICPTCGAVKGTRGACKSCGAMAERSKRPAPASNAAERSATLARIVQLRAELAVENAKLKNVHHPTPCYDVAGGNDYRRLE